MTRLTSYRIIDHGVSHSQYFQGCGIAFTDFEHVVTGIGCSPREAIDDAVEQIAQQSIEIPGVLEKDVNSMSAVLNADCDADEMFYRVSIQYNC